MLKSETRPILDEAGRMIGELTLPAETSERRWAELLGSCVRPVTIDAQVERMRFGRRLVASFAASLKSEGLVVDDVARTLVKFAYVEAALRTGALEAALALVRALPAGDSDLSPERSERIASQIVVFLGHHRKQV